MKKVIHTHSNIFDSTHQREIKSTDNVFGKFLTNEGLYDEIEIEDYLQKILSEYFSYDNLHFTFISEFNYPFSEILLISDDKIIFQA